MTQPAQQRISDEQQTVQAAMRRLGRIALATTVSVAVITILYYFVLYIMSAE